MLHVFCLEHLIYIYIHICNATYMPHISPSPQIPFSFSCSSFFSPWLFIYIGFALFGGDDVAFAFVIVVNDYYSFVATEVIIFQENWI